MKIIFDASILANGTIKTSSRSGVFFVAYNILRELSKRKNISLILYVQDKFSSAVEFIKDDPFLEKMKFYDESYFKRMSLYKCDLRKRRKNAKSIIGKIYFNFIRSCLSFVLKFITIYHKDKMDLNYDLFFSLIFKIPDEIRNNDKIKRFTISYDMIPFILPEYYPEVQRGNFWFRGLADSLNKQDYFFSISNHSKKDLIKYNKNIDSRKITTTYLAASDNFYQCKDKNKIAKVLEKYKISKNTKYIFSLCTLEPRKNLIHAVKCFIKMIKDKKVDDLYFVLGGGHWDAFIKKLEKEIQNFDKYKDKIIKIGYVDDEDLAPLYSRAMFFIYPSLYEGFGLPPLEAMKCGTPVITSNNSSLPEVVGDAGIMINPKSEKQLVDAIYKLYKDEDLRKELNKKGLKQAEMFSWEKTVNKMIKKFEEVLKFNV